MFESCQCVLAESLRWRYVAAVINVNCSECGAELVLDARFCRRCGAEISGTAVDSSELPTEILEPRSDISTSRLKVRTTSPETPRRVLTSDSAAKTDSAKATRRRSILIGIAVLVLLICAIAAAVAYIRINSHSRTTNDEALIYPGSQTIVDFASGDGRAMQLQTPDSLEKVIAWYEKSIKPTKTMRLTSTSVVLKNDNVTTTLASEGGKTNILIKRVK